MDKLALNPWLTIQWSNLSHVRQSETVLDPGFHALDSGFQVLYSSREWNLVGFWIELDWAGFWIRKTRILDSTSKNFQDSGIPIPLDDVALHDSQRRSLEQHSVAMLEKCCTYSKQCRSNVAMLCCAKNRYRQSSRITSPLHKAIITST